MPKRKPGIKHAEIVQQFAARLREVRSSRGMTQAELARSAHVAVSYIWRLNLGLRLRDNLVDRLAKSLGTTTHNLLPTGDQPDSVPMLRDQATKLFNTLLGSADLAHAHDVVPVAGTLVRIADSTPLRIPLSVSHIRNRDAGNSEVPVTMLRSDIASTRKICFSTRAPQTGQQYCQWAGGTKT